MTERGARNQQLVSGVDPAPDIRKAGLKAIRHEHSASNLAAHSENCCAAPFIFYSNNTL